MDGGAELWRPCCSGDAETPPESPGCPALRTEPPYSKGSSAFPRRLSARAPAGARKAFAVSRGALASQGSPALESGLRAQSVWFVPHYPSSTPQEPVVFFAH